MAPPVQCNMHINSHKDLKGFNRCFGFSPPHSIPSKVVGKSSRFDWPVAPTEQETADGSLGQDCRGIKHGVEHA